MSMKVLTIVDFINGTPVASGFLGNDKAAREFVLSMEDLADPDVNANGAVLIVDANTKFIKATADNTDSQLRFSNALLGIIDGVVEMIIRNQEILTIEQAQATADSELARISQIQYTHEFPTRVEGFKPGQQYMYINANVGLSILFTIESVTAKYESFDDEPENVLYTVKAATVPIDPKKFFIRVAKRAFNPQQKVFTKNSPL